MIKSRTTIEPGMKNGLVSWLQRHLKLAFRIIAILISRLGFISSNFYIDNYFIT